MTARIEAIRERQRAFTVMEFPKALQGDVAWLLSVLEDVRDAANGCVKGLKAFDHTEHPDVALYDVREALRRHLGDWLDEGPDAEQRTRDHAAALEDEGGATS